MKEIDSARCSWDKRAMSPVLLVAAFVIVSASQTVRAQQPADIVLHNGKILTVDENFSTAQAVAIAANRITAVGRNDNVLQQAGPNTLKIDLKGRTVVPGLIDTHATSLGPYPNLTPVAPEKRRNFSVDWRGISRKDEVLTQIRGQIEKFKPPVGEWLTFSNSPDSVAQNKLLLDEMNRYDLDTVTPNHPVILTLGVPAENGLFLNSKALDILWKEHGDFVKKYGRFWVGTDGQPDGHLEAPATRLVLIKYSPRSKAEDIAPGYRKSFEEESAQGITAVSAKQRLNAINAFKILEKQGVQTVRVAYGLGFDYFGGITDVVNGLKPFEGTIGSGSDFNWANSMGISSTDGASTRACTNHKRAEAYGDINNWWPVGQCYTDNEFRGGSGRAASISGNYFRDWIMNLPRYGLRLANDHVAGDRTVANILTMIEEIQKQYGPAATKDWAMDHCTFIDPKDVARAARLGLMFSCAPKYIAGNSPSAAKSYGEQFAHTFIVPVKSMIDAGMKVAYESADIVYIWEDLEQLLVRKDKNGKVWGLQERLDKPTTLKTATIWAAHYVLKPDKLGSIEPGKLADLTVLDMDYLTIPAEQVGDIQPQLTVFDGKIVFVHTDFANEYNLRPDGATISTYKDLRERRPSRAEEEVLGDDGG